MIFDMMQGNIRVATYHLEHSRLEPDERKALLGLHGRASARFAWMQLVRGRSAEALGIVHQAVKLNRLWPLSLFFWLGQRYVWGRPIG